MRIIMRPTTVYSLSVFMLSYCTFVIHAKQYSPANSKIYRGAGPSQNLLQQLSPDYYQIQELTKMHNDFRRKVPATNMRRLEWSNELAESAQASANRCDFRHVPNHKRSASENIWAASDSDFSNAPFLWYNEVNNKYCDCNHAFKACCGHYIVMSWATSHQLGCGFAKCSNIAGMPDRYRRQYVFVCHYAPKGGRIVYNTRDRTRWAVPAYKLETQSKGRCSDCPDEAPHCDKGLCYSNPWKQQ